jgi:hypothetical protein
LFDLVIIYDEDSRVNSYAGGPTLDRHQVRLRNLTVAIFDYAGYLKPLKHVPMLLVGGLRAWCQVAKIPLRQISWETEAISSQTKVLADQLSKDKPKISTDIAIVERRVDELDLDAESQWLESLHSDGCLYLILKDSNDIGIGSKSEVLIIPVQIRRN